MLPHFLVAVVAVVAWIAATVIWGYPALIIGALIGVAVMYAFIIGLTASGLFVKKGDSAH